MSIALTYPPIIEPAGLNCEIWHENPSISSVSRFRDAKWFCPEEMEHLASNTLYIDFECLMRGCSKWPTMQRINMDLTSRQLLYYMRVRRTSAWVTIHQYSIQLRTIIDWMCKNDIRAFRNLAVRDVETFFAHIREATNHLPTFVRYAVIFKSLIEFGQAELLSDYQPFDPFPGQSAVQAFPTLRTSVPRVKTPPLPTAISAQLYRTSYEFLQEIGPLIIEAARAKRLYEECRSGDLRAKLCRYREGLKGRATGPMICGPSDAIHFLIWAAFIQLVTVTGARNGEILKLPEPCLVKRTINGVDCFWVRGQPSKRRRQAATVSEWQISEQTLLAISTLKQLASVLEVRIPGNRLFFKVPRKWAPDERPSALRATTSWAGRGLRRFAWVVSGITDSASLVPRSMRVGLAEALAQEPSGIILANRALNHATLGATSGYTNTSRNRRSVAAAVAQIARS
jgi:hypothetical protein